MGRPQVEEYIGLWSPNFLRIGSSAEQQSMLKLAHRPQISKPRAILLCKTDSTWPADAAAGAHAGGGYLMSQTPWPLRQTHLHHQNFLRHPLLAAAPPELDLHRRPDRMLFHHIHQVLGSSDVLAADGQNLIAKQQASARPNCRLQTGLVCRAARLDADHQHAFQRQQVVPMQLRRQLQREVVRRDSHTQVSILRVAPLDQLLNDSRHGVHGDREADAGEGTGGAGDHRVHADQPAPRVEQRTAAVPRVDRGVGLDQVAYRPARVAAHLAAQAGDDAVGQRLVEPEGVADGEDLLTHAQVVGPAPNKRNQITTNRSLHLQNSEITVRVRTNQDRLARCSVC
mmetsp:Transcript_54143/g.155546  ORF Transcript_54143/g.155546 Transcript_54143/m.155546 type:complete len:341 (+) Transcript_54143:386-1408(+)